VWGSDEWTSIRISDKTCDFQDIHKQLQKVRDGFFRTQSKNTRIKLLLRVKINHCGELKKIIVRLIK